ncbi:CDP-glycerol:glycerophosphate glycerophosphotransferase [Paenarthrobacter sp. Z7-10]|uniref:bifunctional glycosyltransferase/CDP-glycerol:glycerophosphate glycerophosphotransferase n=1 Tax=Paenarthrobacter sp. Z7-10 TaxID=2787635 RepID=UPI0022A9F123|nr:CDP-glycerol:glycerophosphate glycerophosphotransferase [Paenarthrobacter sp. Z7-10]MCZ2403449.1 CDP-glycerol:glycerophosphate glycerophosphotransferase [Paenarthrobacter sp. Z7-10]
MAGRKQPQILSNLRAAAEARARRAWRALPQERRNQVKEVLQPDNVAKVQQVLAVAKPQAPSTEPQIAIVILANPESTNVQTTLDSISAQKPRALEIFVIDASTDDAVHVYTQNYADRDARVRYILADTYRAEESLGILAETQAAYVLVLTAGDIVQKSALDKGLRSLRESESEFAVGTVGVTSGKKTIVAAWQRDLHAAPLQATDVEEIPQILIDGFLCNKLFARSFWLRELAEVPAGIEHWQYEITRRAYLKATSFDVLDLRFCDTTNDDGAKSPIREDLCRTDFLKARLERLGSLQREFQRHASSELYARWITQELGTDLFPYYEVVPRTDDAYWVTLQANVASIAAESSLLWTEIKLHNRLILSSVLSDSRADVEVICNSRSDYGSSFASGFSDGQLVALPPYLRALGHKFSPDLLIMEPVDLRLVSKLNHFEWREDGMLEIGGYAFISSVDPDASDMKLTAAVVARDGNAVAELTVSRLEDPRVDWEANDNWTGYKSAAFQALIDPSALLGSETENTSELHVLLTATAYDKQVQSPILKRDLTGSTGELASGSLLDGRRLAIEIRPASTGLTLIPVQPMYQATDITLIGRTLKIVVESQSAPLAAKISVECLKLGLKKSATCISVEGHTAVYAITLPPLSAQAGPRTEYQWQVRLDSGFRAPQPIAWREDTRRLEEKFDQSASLRLRLTGYGFLMLDERKTRILADSVELSSDRRTLTVAGTADFPAIHAPRFVLSSGKLIIPASEVRLDVRTNTGSNEFWAKFTLPQTPWSEDEFMPESGAYSVRYVPPGVADPAGYWIPVSRRLQAGLPARLDAGLSEIGLSRSPAAAALTVHLRPPFRAEEQGRYNQQRLRQEAESSELTDSVLFMCFGGRRATDTPRRLLEEFQRRNCSLPMYWAVEDYSVPVPDSATPVLIGSSDWYRLLNQCRLLINNNNFPFYFRKKEGQTYIQTWHGTPLKKLGNDVAKTSFSLSYWNLMAREASFWDALLAQNDYAAEVLAKCFGFDGKVVAEGYPRNDSLKSPDAEKVRTSVRAKLGIPEGKTAILYAPTWRDDAKNAAKQYELVTYLDFEAAQKALGNNYVLLLRGHHNIADQRQTAANTFVIDVTEYPEVNDLYLAADILINDYSSVMFDFCVTRKPILFLTPDIAQYRDSTRGFYFDLEEMAPGPILMTTDEVVREIKRLPVVKRRYAKKYNAFVNTFAPHCDGHATDRVFDALNIPLEPSIRPIAQPDPVNS